MTIADFIKKRRYLVWHTEDFKHLSEEAIVEAVLNYGDFNDVKKLFSILGIKRTAEIFMKQTRRRRCNYYPEVKNYFNLYFKKYAQPHA